MPALCRQSARSVPSNCRLALVLLLAAWLSCSPAVCADERATESQVKAAFLYNFANFVSWPKPIGDRFRLCVIGSDPFGEHLDPLIGRSVHDSILVIEQYDSADDLHDCHLAYISPSLQPNLAQVLAKLAGQPILTVSDIAAFTDAGGMIGLKVFDNNVRFDINTEAADTAGLSISSKLLSLSSPVNTGH